MKTYTSASNARRAADAVAAKNTRYTPKAIKVRKVDAGHVVGIVYETTRANALAAFDAAPDNVCIIGRPRRRSTVESPCALVWDLAQDIVVKGKGRRKDVIDAAVAQGVNKYTARTQYQRWYEAYHAR